MVLITNQGRKMSTFVIDAIKEAGRISLKTTEMIAAEYSRDELSKMITRLGLDRPAARDTASLARTIKTGSARIMAALSDIPGVTVDGISVADTFREQGTNEERCQRYIERIEGLLAATKKDGSARYSVEDVCLRVLAEWNVEMKSYAPATHKKYVGEFKECLREWSKATGSSQDKVLVNKLNNLLAGSVAHVAQALNTAYSATKDQRQRNLKRPVSDLLVQAVATIEKAADIGCGSDGVDHREVIIALMLVTGRRTSEVCSHMSEFVALDENTISFSGRAKTRGSDGGLDKPVTFKVPGSATAVERAIMALDKAGYRNYSHSEVNKKYSMPIGRYLKKMVPQGVQKINEIADPSISPNDLRKMFASYQKARYFDETVHGSLRVFLGSILGHSEGDHGTGDAYEDYASSLWSDEALTL